VEEKTRIWAKFIEKDGKEVHTTRHIVTRSATAYADSGLSYATSCHAMLGEIAVALCGGGMGGAVCENIPALRGVCDSELPWLRVANLAVVIDRRHGLCPVRKFGVCVQRGTELRKMISCSHLWG
jgi:hypothetical protein